MTVVKVERAVRQGDKQSQEVAHYISSSTARAQVLAEGVRHHWSIENSQHWVLDVIFAEDRCRTRHGNAAENLAWLRKMALAVFGQDQSKGSIPTRQFRAAADDAYRLHLLNILSEQYA
jgi:predicted transposase YbfD/YdcC